MTDESPTEHPTPVVVATFAHRGEAEVCKALLDSSGIESVIVDEVEGGVLPVDGEAGVALLVPAKDEHLARGLLAPVDPTA